MVVLCVVCQAQADMATEGEEVNAVSKDAAFKNLAKTLSLLLERLEKMKTGDYCSCNVLDV